MSILKRTEEIAISERTIHLGKRYDRFRKEVKYTRFFAVNTKSIKLQDEMFTNYLSKEGDEKQKKALLFIQKNIANNSLDENKFEIIELYEQRETTERLLRIINSYKTHQVSSIEEVFKCKYWNEPKVQIYCVDDGAEIKIVLFDVHHLGLPGDLFKNGARVPSNKEKIYEKRKNASLCISTILSPET